jgi:apolipoprotein N-acyltransferase
MPLHVLKHNRHLFVSACSLLLGALLALAFAPYFLWPLAILIPAALFWLNRDTTRLRQLFFNGWLFGVGYFGCGVYWLYYSLHDFGMAPPLVAGGITALMVVYLALTPGLILVCWRRAELYLGGAAVWLLPLIWFGLEWFKGWFSTGMPWLSLGYSQTESPLAGFAPLVGVYGISALCILMSVGLFRALHARRYLPLLPLLLVPAAGWALQQIDWTESMAQPLKVTMVQGNIPQQLKWRSDQRQHIFNTYWRETEQHWDSDLIIWPETALPGHSLQIRHSILPGLQAAALRHDSIILSGLVYGEEEQQRFYNSVMQFGANQGVYHKRHLVAFGEYFPMRWLLDWLSGMISIPYSDLAAGPEQQELMQVRGYRLGVSICFEDVFSRDILLDLPEANMLVNVSNDAWFGNSNAPHQHLQIAQMRSLETERAMMRSTNTGISAFIDHKGRARLSTEMFETGSISAVVQGRSGLTPFYYFAQVQGLLAIVLVLGSLMAPFFPRRGG